MWITKGNIQGRLKVVLPPLRTVSWAFWREDFNVVVSWKWSERRKMLARSASTWNLSCLLMQTIMENFFVPACNNSQSCVCHSLIELRGDNGTHHRTFGVFWLYPCHVVISRVFISWPHFVPDGGFKFLSLTAALFLVALRWNVKLRFCRLLPRRVSDSAIVVVGIGSGGLINWVEANEHLGWRGRRAIRGQSCIDCVSFTHDPTASLWALRGAAVV